jgi:hypothetical protein
MGGRVGLIDTAVKSVTWETPIVVLENGNAMYIEIGKWIDTQLDTPQNREKVQHFTERNMELLDIPMDTVFIPTTNDDGNVTWGPVTAITRHDPGTQLYKIQTLGGRSVIVTESKSLLIWNHETKKMLEKPTPEIRVGDCVPVTEKLCEPPVVLEHIVVSTYLSKANCKDTEFSEHFILNQENGIFLGLFLADGNTNKNIINITNNEIEIQEFVKQWFIKHSITFKITQNENKIGSSTTISGYSSVLEKFITRLVGKGAENKFVPNEAFIAPECFIIGLLNGYFSGDGTIGKNNIEVGSASSRLIDGVSMLCSRLGIFGKKFKTQLKKNNLGTKNIKPTYRFSLRSQWGKLFAEKIVLLEEKKNTKMKSIIWNKIHRNFDTYNDVVLDPITEITIIGVEEHPKVYDLTIPTTFNFGLANGLQVRDTSTTGYIQRRLIKGLEDLMVSYDMTVRTNKNKIVQFSYGDDNIDTTKVENQMIPIVTMTTQEIYAHFHLPDEKGNSKVLSNIFLKNTMTRYKKQMTEMNAFCEKYTDFMVKMRGEIITHVFKNKGDSIVNCPVAFQYLISNVQGQTHLTSTSLVDITLLEAFQLIEENYENLEKLHYTPPTQLFKTLYFYYLSPKDLLIVKRFNKNALTLLLSKIVLDYKRAIINPGEMVGMIAGQSIGEVSTQMTLNSVTYETEILVRNSLGEIQKVCIGDFIENKIRIAKKTEYYENKDTTYAEVEDYYEIPSCDTNGNVLWKRIEAVTRHPVINADGTNTMLKITTKEEREVIVTKAKSLLKLVNGKVIPVDGDSLKIGDYLPVSKKPIDFKEKKEIAISSCLENVILDFSLGHFLGDFVAEDFYHVDNYPWMETLISQNQGQGTRLLDQLVFSNQDCILGFLEGYMSSKGSVDTDTNTILLSSTTKELLIDIQQMLNTLDVYSYIQKRKTYNNFNNEIEEIEHFLCITNAFHFAQYLSPICQIRKDILEHSTFILEQTNAYDYIPNEIDGQLLFEPRTEYSCVDLIFDPIVKIEQVANTTNYAYDLTVADTRTFNIYN